MSSDRPSADPALPPGVADAITALGRWWRELDRGWQATVLGGLLVVVVAAT